MSEENSITPTETAAPMTIADLKPKMKLKGVVKRLELYGAFIDIGIDVNALVHISKLGKERVNRVSDVLKEGDEVTIWIDKVNPENQQLTVTMVEPLAVEWHELKKGQVYPGRISRLENFGAFIDIGAEREGLVHISELSHDYVKHPSEIYKVGDEVQVQVLGFSKRKRRIDLSIKALLEKPEAAMAASLGQSKSQTDNQGIDEDDEYEDEVMPTAMEIALRRAMGEPASKAAKAKRNRRKSKADKRALQEDILSRTLHTQHEG